MQNIITVTSPFLPSLDEIDLLLNDIWDRKWLTPNTALRNFSTDVK